MQAQGKAEANYSSVDDQEDIWAHLVTILIISHAVSVKFIIWYMLGISSTINGIIVCYLIVLEVLHILNKIIAWKKKETRAIDMLDIDGVMFCFRF